MKNAIEIVVMAGLMACLMCSCKKDSTEKIKIEEEIYSEVEKSLDTFFIQSVSVFSIDRIKKVAKRIEQIGLSKELAPDEEQVLDTLPDNSNITFMNENGNFVFYLKDAISKDAASTIKLYSTNVKESLRADPATFELYENIRRRNCEHWLKICNNPDFPLSHKDKLMCKLYITFYCK